MNNRWMSVLILLLSGLAQADDRLQQLLEGTATTPALSGLQISLMEAGKPTDAIALGFAQRTANGAEPLRVDHKIRIASISKLVVALGVMRLVERDQLSLDVDVSSYLGWRLRNPQFPEQPITLRSLLAHTSSIRDADRYFIGAGEGSIQDFFDPESAFWSEGAHWASNPQEVTGQYFKYSNLNFGVIAEVIERVTNQRFDQFMRAEVLVPLGISADFDPCNIPTEQRAAAFRKRDAEDNWNADGLWYAQVDGATPNCFYGIDALEEPEAYLSRYQPGANATLFSPQGGLRASADDLVVILRVLANGGEFAGKRFLKPSSVADMLAPVWTLDPELGNGMSAGEAEPGSAVDGLMTSYGLSVHRIDMRGWGFDEGPQLLLGHLGEAYGVLSHALIDPASGDGIATIITGTADDPAKHPGHSPLYRVEEAVVQWWIDRRAK